MIVLIQRRLDADLTHWDDINTPRKRNEMPERGVFPLVTTPNEFAKEVADAGLAGEYRVFMGDGRIHHITITRRDQYVIAIEDKTPVV